MRAENHVVRVAEMFAHSAEHGAVFFGHGVANSVGQIQDRRTVVDGDLASFAKEFQFGTAGVFGGEFHFGNKILGQLDHRADGFKRLLARHV